VPRRIFPAGTVTNTTGAPLRLTFYANSTTNRRETDLYTVDSSNNLSERIPNGVILADTSGAYSAFAGPEDIDALYLNAHNGSTRSAIGANDVVASGSHGATRSNSLYNFKASNTRRLKASLAKGVGPIGGSTNGRLAFIGDSITEGSTTTGSHWRSSFVARVRGMLAELYGHAGTGVVDMINNTWSTDTRIVTTGTWTNSAYGAFGHGAIQAGSSATLVFTPEAPVDSFTVYYVKGSAGGTFSLTVDAGTPTTVDSSAASEAAGVTTVSAGTSGNSHTLTITAPSSGNIYLTRIEATYGSTGVRVDRIGRGGSLASDALATRVDAGVTTVNSPYMLFTATPADCTFLCFGVNEFLGDVAPSTFSTNMQSLITDAAVNGDVVLIVPPSDATGQTYAMSAYRQVLYSLADSNDIPLIDLSELFGTYTLGNAAGLFYSDKNHPNDAGHKAIAHAVFAALMSVSSRPTRGRASRFYNFAQTNLTRTSTSWADFLSGSEITIPAAPGDVLIATIGIVSGSDASDFVMDVATIVSNAVVNYFASRTSSTTSNGLRSWYGPTGVISAINASYAYVVQSGDVDTDGNVTLRLRYRLASGTTKTIFLASSQGQWRVERQPAL
jgi:lysophospholipase L1-like esterase